MACSVKIRETILRSSAWLEDEPTRLVWLTILFLADERGFLLASVGGLAHQARVSFSACARALEILERPDPDSRGAVFQGRRIRAVDGGWMLMGDINHRDVRTPKQIATAERVRRHRALRAAEAK